MPPVSHPQHSPLRIDFRLRCAAAPTVLAPQASPLDPRGKYLIRHTTRDSKAMLAGIGFRMDINTMEHQTAETWS